MAEPTRQGVPTLEVKDLNVYYGASHALQGVDLVLQEGVLSVVGRNGMGKTTLCKAIMGLVPVSSGTISFHGEQLVGRKPAQIAQLGIGYVPQGRRLWRSLTVEEHLRMVSAGHKGAWTVERIYSTFPRLAERKHNGGAQLSGGEQQMLAIGRALMTEPKLLLLDEPTLGLAPLIIAQIFEIIKEIREQGVTVFLVEQNAHKALQVADRGYVLETGKVVLSDTGANLLVNDEVRKAYLGA